MTELWHMSRQPGRGLTWSDCDRGLRLQGFCVKTVKISMPPLSLPLSRSLLSHLPNLLLTFLSSLLYLSLDPFLSSSHSSSLYAQPLQGHCPRAVWLPQHRTDTELSGLSWRVAPGISNGFCLLVFFFFGFFFLSM